VHQDSLQNKVVVITGAAGEIGTAIGHKYLRTGAILILTGRTFSKLEVLKQSFINNNPELQSRLFIYAMDNSKPESVSRIALEIKQSFHGVDVLINNAGSAGPKQMISDLPFREQDLRTDNETVVDAIGSLLLGPWLVTKAFMPYLNANASVINISTIFSKTAYFGRAAYVVPKAALNAVSKQMAVELGKDIRNIRVNTIYPGPVDSDRIQNVFKAMDKLQQVIEGTTYKEYTSKMLLQQEPLLISKNNIADTALFLGGESGAGFTGHSFEVTHGMQIESANTILVSPPRMHNITMGNESVLIIGIEEKSDFAKKVYSNPVFKEAEVFYNSMPNNMTPDVCLVLTPNGLKRYGEAVLSVPESSIIAFCNKEILRILEVAKEIESLSKDKPPKVIFLSNAANNSIYDEILNTAIEQLIRVWRQERQHKATLKNANQAGNICHLISQYGSEEDSQATLDTIAWLATAKNPPSAINIELEPSQLNRLPAMISAFTGLHNDKVALVTGASEGIGAEIAKLLLLSGAKVAIAARDSLKLNLLKQTLIQELEAEGFNHPENRILIISNADIGAAEVPQLIVNEVLEKFGRIDYLINNAGIAGAEEMVVDMELDTWERTLKANLISNYELLMLTQEQMRQRKYGHILNISSHFGGVRHTTVVYPNRADYALSKTGQRILAETLAEYLGPEIQINAIAPGPVEGARIRGGNGREGLYQKRARLILENKRLELVYEYLLKNFSKYPLIPTEMLYKLAVNKIAELRNDNDFKELITKIDAAPAASSSEYILTSDLAHKLLQRLQLGLLLEPDFSEQEFVTKFNEPKVELAFFSQQQIAAGVEKIRTKMLNSLALKRMPSNFDVAREVVYYLSNNNVTGETLYPSCGLKFDDYVTETEWSPGKLITNKPVDSQVVYIIGNAMLEAMLATIKQFTVAKKLIVIVNDKNFAAKLCEELSDNNTVEIQVLADNIDPLRELLGTINNNIRKYAPPDVIISFPLNDVYDLVTDELPSTPIFEQLIKKHINNNFMILKRASLIKNCKVLIVTEAIKDKHTDSKMAITIIEFLKNTLRTLTATAAKEANLLPHAPYFYQIEPNGSNETLINAVIDLAAAESEKRYHTGMIFKICEQIK
jgi:malonyl-CoA reductase/3-hydroxypropionate dehydrogenase (NADP+)